MNINLFYKTHAECTKVEGAECTETNRYSRAMVGATLTQQPFYDPEAKELCIQKGGILNCFDLSQTDYVFPGKPNQLYMPKQK